MPKRRHIVILLACGLVVVLYALLSTPREPTYKGRSLSQWVEAYHDRGGAEQAEAAAAIRQIGASAVPCLLAWIRDPLPGWKTTVRAARLRAPGGQGSFLTDARRPFYAASAFSALGPAGNGAIPELTRLANDAEHYFKSIAATQALGRSGKAGAPPLLGLLQSDNVVIRAHAAKAIGHLGSNALPAIPLLLQYVTNVADMDVAEAAAATLGTLGFEPDRVVPALSNALHSPPPLIRRTAVRALGRFATNSAAARPALAIALVDPEASVRALATNALLKIAPEYLTNAPPK